MVFVGKVFLTSFRNFSGPKSHLKFRIFIHFVDAVSQKTAWFNGIF
jgi:hypothetical protein